ncbi:MAG: SAC family polyphosphoinositide phosphatase, partial [Candidatus Pacebacteria bacterium]|nr:SAC family polyphosphoinositide phosphatase [Candidatus Paceibacterota bacterium]
MVTRINNAGVIYKDHISDIFRIKEATLVSFTYDQNIGKLSSEIRAIVAGVSELLQQGFYFSYHFDLTNSLQRNSKVVSNCATLFDRANKQYVWNYAISKEFMAQFVSTRWLTPVIQGYVGTAEDELSGKKLKLILISRRRYEHAGTRYNARGIDDEGNVANMVETEQIVVYGNITYSFVQIRGSVPVFWNQTGMLAAIQLTRSPEMSYSAFSKHFDSMVKTYKRVLMFDLLSATKQGEVVLSQAYRENALV